MFPQLGSPLIAITPVIGIVHSERHCTPVSCSTVHSCAAWLQSCGSPGWLALHSCERMLCALLLIVLRLYRPTSRIHSWGLQHTSARTYCSPSSCMRSKSQLRLPCRLLVLYCSRLAVLSIYCSLMSSCGFHAILYIYSGIRCHSHNPVGLCFYERSMRPYKVFLTALCQLWLRHHTDFTLAWLPTWFVVS
jgi:hypothetical protein